MATGNPKKTPEELTVIRSAAGRMARGIPKKRKQKEEDDDETSDTPVNPPGKKTRTTVKTGPSNQNTEVSLQQSISESRIIGAAGHRTVNAVTPRSIPDLTAIMEKSVALPFVLKSKGLTFEITNQSNAAQTYTDLWTTLARRSKSLGDLNHNEHFGTSMLSSGMQNGLHHSLTGDLFPVLTGGLGELRYKSTTTLDRQMNKQKYIDWLKRIKGNATQLLTSMSAEPPSDPDRSPSAALQMLIAATGEQNIPYRTHIAILNETNKSITKLGESIRRELMLFGIMLSNLSMKVTENLTEHRALALFIEDTIGARKAKSVKSAVKPTQTPIVPTTAPLPYQQPSPYLSAASPHLQKLHAELSTPFDDESPKPIRKAKSPEPIVSNSIFGTPGGKQASRTFDFDQDAWEDRLGYGKAGSEANENPFSTNNEPAEPKAHKANRDEILAGPSSAATLKAPSPTVHKAKVIRNIPMLLLKALGTDAHPCKCEICVPGIMETLTERAAELLKAKQEHEITEQEKRVIEINYRTNNGKQIQEMCKTRYEADCMTALGKAKQDMFEKDTENKIKGELEAKHKERMDALELEYQDKKANLEAELRPKIADEEYEKIFGTLQQSRRRS